MTDHATQTATPRRTGLQNTRDIALTIMAILVSITCAVLLYVGAAAGSALSNVSDRLSNPTPTPAITLDLPTPEPIPTNSKGEECIGEVVVPGC